MTPVERSNRKVSSQDVILHIYNTHKTSIIFGTVLFFVSWFFFAHVEIIRRIDPRLPILKSFGMALKDIFSAHIISFTPFPATVTGIYIALLLGAFSFLIFIISTNGQYDHYDDDTVQGASKWFEEFDEYNRKYTEPFGEPEYDSPKNMIISEHMRLSLDNRRTRRNSNVFIVGGSGVGKSYTLVGPNLMQMNSSYVVTDPSGELFAQYGKFFEYNGYKVRCINLQFPESGNHYNPFHYIESALDITNFATTILDNTSDPQQKGGDQFWSDAAKLLISALTAYMLEKVPPEEQTFYRMMTMIADASNIQLPNGELEEMSDEEAEKQYNESKVGSSLDHMFGELPDSSWAKLQYIYFKQAPEKTALSILISLSTRLSSITVDSIREMMSKDDMELESIGDEPTVIFIIIPTAEKSYNYIASIMYSQLFQLNYRYAQNEAHLTYLVRDSEQRIWKSFRGKDGSEEIAKKNAMEFFERAKKAEIVENKEMGWWELRYGTKLLAYRGSKEEAEKARKKIQGGDILPNKDQSQRGHRMPIHVQFILDEFYNTGRIPNFDNYIATIRKYDISVMVVVQSVTMMQALFKELWESIAANCDTVLALGGGADTITAKWFSENLGKETRRTMSISYSGRGGASTSFSSTGVNLLDPAEYRAMNEDDCIVLFRGLQGIYDSKFAATKHPNYEFVQELCKSGDYIYSEKKTKYLMENLPGLEENIAEQKHGDTKPKDPAEREKENNQQAQAEEQARENQGSDGKPIVGDPQEIPQTHTGSNPTPAAAHQEEVNQSDAGEQHEPLAPKVGATPKEQQDTLNVTVQTFERETNITKAKLSQNLMMLSVTELQEIMQEDMQEEEANL